MKWPTLEGLDEARYKRLHERGWHRWFAWYPIVVGDHWYWLTTIERKREGEGNPYLGHVYKYGYWIYRERSS
ncbi:hypothetical protein RR21198_4864 [Rhodococcus rhodochrous ATCC 21198]|nr:hypothetical protein RR21198_4864 [Rhodococcus rhodochrous ATCC 21198]